MQPVSEGSKPFGGGLPSGSGPGQRVTKVIHQGQGHKNRNPSDCLECGQQVVAILRGQCGLDSHQTNNGGLGYGDVLLLSRDEELTEVSGIVQGVRDSGVPLRAVRGDEAHTLVDKVSSDEVIATWAGYLPPPDHFAPYRILVFLLHHYHQHHHHHPAGSGSPPDYDPKPHRHHHSHPHQSGWMSAHNSDLSGVISKAEHVILVMPAGPGCDDADDSLDDLVEATDSSMMNDVQKASKVGRREEYLWHDNLDRGVTRGADAAVDGRCCADLSMGLDCCEGTCELIACLHCLTCDCCHGNGGGHDGNCLTCDCSTPDCRGCGDCDCGGCGDCDCGGCGDCGSCDCVIQ